MSLIFVALTSVRTETTSITFPLQVKWSVALSAPPSQAPAFDDLYVYVPLRSNELIALKLEDGSKGWSVECPMTAPPAAGDGLLFVGREGLIQGRARTDGLVQWERKVAGRVVALYWDTGWLLASIESGPFMALRGSDGEILWQHELGSPLSGPPATAGDRLHVPLEDGRLVVMALESGNEIWTRKFADAPVGIAPVGDKVFVGARDNQMYALDAKDGDIEWQWRTGADLLGLPATDGKRVYFIALDHVLRGHNRNNGSMLWKRVLPMRPLTGPMLVGETLIVSGVAAELRAYNVLDGRPVGSEFIVKGAENEEMLLAAPPHLAANDVIVMITKGGQVRAVHSPPPPPTADPRATPNAAPPSAVASPADAESPPDGVATPDSPAPPQP